MYKYDVQIILRPTVRSEFGRGSRYFNIEFEAESKEQAEDFGKQYFEGFVKYSIEIITNATLITGIVKYY